MRLSEIIRHIETEMPLRYQESYDNCGLLVGEADMEVNAALITLDVTEKVLDEALALGCNLVVSHHPVIFLALKSLTGRSETERIVMRALRQGIALYALHTNLDNHHLGVNRMLAEKLGLRNMSILRNLENQLLKVVVFCPADHAAKLRQAMFDAGGGHIGNYDSCSFSAAGKGTFRAGEETRPFVGQIGELHTEHEERIEIIVPAHLEQPVIEAMHKTHPYEEVAFDIYTLRNKHNQLGAGMVGELAHFQDAVTFLKKVKHALNIPVVRHTACTHKKVKRVAICGGAGSFLIKDALAVKADIFLTGDLKYHDFFIPEDNMILADIGHYESEQFTKELIFTILKKKFTTFALHISRTVTNPVNYL